MSNPKKLLKKLSGRGPYKVLRGELAVTGVPGVVYTPEAGKDLPAIVFGHGWLRTAHAYEKTLAHLASWGIVAAAPNTQVGPFASDHTFSLDLRAALEAISTVRLGLGHISVHPHRLGVAGHGFGAAAAVIAASEETAIRGLAAIFPAPGTVEASLAARQIDVRTMVIAEDHNLDSMTSNAGELTTAINTGHDEPRASLLTAKGLRESGFAETKFVRSFLGSGSPDKGTQKTVRGLLTGFVLGHLAEEKAYSAFVEDAPALGRVHSVDLSEFVPNHDNHLRELLKR